MLVVGGRRLEHLAYIANDPLIQRFCQLRVLPAARTVSRWLKQFTMKTVERLQGLNVAVIAYVIPGLKLGTMTVDVDGTVVSTGLQVERAQRGYNPHHRKVPSYYPIMAHLAETTHILRVRNRSGNVHDGGVLCQERDEPRLGVPRLCLGGAGLQGGKRCKWLINKPVQPPKKD